ncbi:FAD-binding oxidoreductase [Humibacter ginsengisoli]
MGFLSALVCALPPGTVLTGPTAVEQYRRDRAQAKDAGTPIAVVRPRTTAEVQLTMRWAAEHHVSVVPRGAGTGLSGGATAVEGGIVLTTERMRDLTVDAATRTVTTQPGVLNAELKDAVAEKGLWYPPDPASSEICSIGGNIATNAGGLCCVKYGVTVDYVLGLQVVLADGRVLRIGRSLVKDVAGLSLLKLFVGSEGTLGVITEVTLRLLPALPPQRRVAAWFRNTADAAGAVAELAATVRPSMLEYMDNLAINAVEDLRDLGLNRAAAALVLAGTDEQQAGAPELETIRSICMRHNPISVYETTAEEGDALAAARRAAIPAIEARGRLLLEDVGVPIPRFTELIDGVERIAALNEVEVALIAHAGDGNTHPLVVYDPSDAELEERAERAYGEIMTLAITLGGTITGEHGVGRLKRPWLVEQIGPDVLEVGRRIKTALDPDFILNPGAIFEETFT